MYTLSVRARRWALALAVGVLVLTTRAGYAKVIQERNLRIPIEKQNEMMRLFHELPVWENTWFHNIRIVKNPLDLWMMQQIIAEVRPDFVVETGTWKGGSALYWASVLHSLGPILLT